MGEENPCGKHLLPSGFRGAVAAMAFLSQVLLINVKTKEQKITGEGHHLWLFMGCFKMCWEVLLGFFFLASKFSRSGPLGPETCVH